MSTLPSENEYKDIVSSVKASSKTRPSHHRVAEANSELRHKDVRSTTLERLRVTWEADNRVEGLPQPVQLGEGLYCLLDNALSRYPPMISFWDAFSRKSLTRKGRNSSRKLFRRGMGDPYHPGCVMAAMNALHGINLWRWDCQAWKPSLKKRSKDGWPKVRAKQTSISRGGRCVFTRHFAITHVAMQRLLKRQGSFRQRLAVPVLRNGHRKPLQKGCNFSGWWGMCIVQCCQ